MTKAIPALALIALTLALAACEAGRSGLPNPHTEAEPAPVAAPAQAQATTNGECKAKEGGRCGTQAACGAPQNAGCGCGSEPARDIAIERGVDPATGKPMQVVGAKLNGASAVTVEQLLGSPDAFAGKTVRLEGDVSAMCHHKRRWFALQDPGDRSGRFVRVLTAPAFLVPPHAIGKKARAEGTVEVVETPAATGHHLAREHDLGPAPTGPQKRVVLRATGAEII